MRTLVLSEETGRSAALLSLEEAGPVTLVLSSPPRRIDREELLRAIAAAAGPVVAHLPSTVGTPLSEAACLADEASWEPGALLDLRGALLGPLLLRLGLPAARRLLALRGPLLEPSDVLVPHRSHGRSAAAVALASELVVRSPGSGRAAGMARELAAFRWALTLPDRLEGVAAFRERRPPSFAW